MSTTQSVVDIPRSVETFTASLWFLIAHLFRSLHVCLRFGSISRQNSHLNKMSVCLTGIVKESRLQSCDCLLIVSTWWLSKPNWDLSHLFNRLLSSSFDAANNFVNQWEVKQYDKSFWLNSFHVRFFQGCLLLNFVIS